jgi:hypothetical protein
MKKVKSSLVTLAVLVALTGALGPMNIVRADDPGGGQGTADSQKKGTTSSSSSSSLTAQQQANALALFNLIMRLLGW